MSYGIYLAVIVGGSGEDTWEREIEIDGDTFAEAALSAQAQADEMRGYPISLDLDVGKTIDSQGSV